MEPDQYGLAEAVVRAEEALSSGDLNSAVRLARAVLQADPSNEVARQILLMADLTQEEARRLSHVRDPFLARRLREMQREYQATLEHPATIVIVRVLAAPSGSFSRSIARQLANDGLGMVTSSIRRVAAAYHGQVFGDHDGIVGIEFTAVSDGNDVLQAVATAFDVEAEVHQTSSQTRRLYGHTYSTAIGIDRGIVAGLATRIDRAEDAEDTAATNAVVARADDLVANLQGGNIAVSSQVASQLREGGIELTLTPGTLAGTHIVSGGLKPEVVARARTAPTSFQVWWKTNPPPWDARALDTVINELRRHLTSGDITASDQVRGSVALAGALAMKFQETGDITVLALAEDQLRHSLMISQTLDLAGKLRFAAFYNLAQINIARYGVTASARELEAAINALREAQRSLFASVEKTTDAELASLLSAIGTVSWLLFMQVRESENLDVAIEYLSRAISLSGPDSALQATSNLASALVSRAQLTATREDIDRALDLYSQAIASVPVDDPRRPELLSNTASALWMRGEPYDVEQAVDLLRLAYVDSPAAGPTREAIESNIKLVATSVDGTDSGWRGS